MPLDTEHSKKKSIKVAIAQMVKTEVLQTLKNAKHKTS